LLIMTTTRATAGCGSALKHVT